MVRVPQLGRNPQLVAGDEAIGKGAAESIAHFGLVAVIASAIKVAVAAANGVVYGLRSGIPRYLPEPEPYHLRDARAEET